MFSRRDDGAILAHSPKNTILSVEISPTQQGFQKPASLPDQESMAPSERGRGPVPAEYTRSWREKGSKDKERKSSRRSSKYSGVRGKESRSPSEKSQKRHSRRSRDPDRKRRGPLKVDEEPPEEKKETADRKRHNVSESGSQVVGEIPTSTDTAGTRTRDPSRERSKTRSSRRSKTEAREPFGGFHPSKIRPEPSSKKFEKAAEEPEGSGDGSYSYETEEEQEKAPLFPKPALTPNLPVDPPPKLALRTEQTPRGGSTFGGADAKEKAALDSFDIKALEIFLELQERGFEMEIAILKELKDDGEWTEAFVSLVRPKRAATGLRYARLVENMINWIKRKEQRTGEQVKDILDRESVWIYLHDLSMKGIGKYTPKGVVNAIRYFGEAFGVDSSAVLCRRVRKLTESYCKQTKPKSQAPMLTLKTLELLEGTVVNPAIQKGIRIAAGKLRLCVQASLRWDDLARTPLANVEWVRRKGSDRWAQITFWRFQDRTKALGEFIPGGDPGG